MRKILTLLATTILSGTPIGSVISCGTISPIKIDGKENISTEFTLTEAVIVTDDNMPVEESIFNQAKIEGRISKDLSLEIFEVTDSENMTKPENTVKSQKGYVVFTARQNDDIPYTGSITIHFTLIKKDSIDISQNITFEQVLDVTDYSYRFELDELRNYIWDKVIDQFKTDTPTDIDAYDISGLELPTKFNTEIDLEMIAKYNGKANTAAKFYSGTITIKLKIISYQAIVKLELYKNNLEPTRLYELVWKEVKQQFSEDVGTSSNYNDYVIDWTTVTEPNIGENTSFNFLAKPNDESSYHYIHVIGNILKEPIELSSVITISTPIQVTQAQRPKVNKDYIWELAMQEAKINGVPELEHFVTTDWQSIFDKNWPSIGRTEQFTVKAINRNTDPMFKGDIEINLKLINQGTNIDLLLLDPILLAENAKHTTETVLKLIWNKIINNDKWNPHLSTNLDDFKITNREGLRDALKDANESHEWKRYGINIDGQQEQVGRDFKVLLVSGDIKVVKAPIEKDVTINLTNKTYQFVPRKAQGVNAQAAYLNCQIWNDIIKDLAFRDEEGSTYGISKVHTDWNYYDGMLQKINNAIETYDPKNGNNLPLEFNFNAKDTAVYNGQITVQFNLTVAVATDFGNINLDSKSLPIFIHSLPKTEQDKKELIEKITKVILNDGIINNKDLKAKDSTIPWKLLAFETATAEFVDQIEFPSANNLQKDLSITIKTIPNQLFNGSVTLKIKLIYQF